MSDFLGFESYLIPLGASISDVATTLKSAFTSRGFQIVRDGLKNNINAIIGTMTRSDYPAENLYDRLPNTFAGQDNVLPIWGGVRLGSAAKVSRVVITTTDDPTNHSINAFSLEWSDNGQDWTTHQSWSGMTHWCRFEARAFTVSTLPQGHVFWRINVTGKNGRGVWISDLTFEDENGDPFVYGTPFFDVIPAASETIGDAKVRGILRVDVSGTQIMFRPLDETKVELPQVVRIGTGTAGAVVPSVTLGPVTIAAVAGTAGSTALDNLRSLYDALQMSVDPFVLDWTWIYLPSAVQNGDENDQIIGIRDTASAASVGITCVAGGHGVFEIGRPTPIRWVSYACPSDCNVMPSLTLTIDLINGFVYYLQINSRHIALAVKTNTAFYGPIHAAWADHEKAMMSMPQGYAPLASIIELVCGYDDGQGETDSWARPTHYWMISAVCNSYPSYPTEYSCVTHPFSGAGVRHLVQDAISSSPNVTNFVSRLYGSNLFFDNQGSVGNDFQIHRVGVMGVSKANEDPLAFLPQLDIQDWFKFRGTTTSESLVLAADTLSTTLSTQKILSTDAPSSVVLVDATGFQSAGFFVWGDECFQYTGKTGNTLTGVVRAKYGTKARTRYSGEVVSQGLWFCIINGGALFCGYNKPS